MRIPLHHLVAFACALALITLSLGRAYAEPSLAERQAQALREAERAERELDFAAAERAYATALSADPTARLSRHAQARLEYLRSHSEGGYTPLAALERMRRELEPSVPELEAFERSVDRFPAGHVRRDARALIAETYLYRLDQPRRAEVACRAWLDEPSLDDAEWLRATKDLALSRARLGDVSGSLDTLRARGLGKSAEAAYLELALVRRWARPLAIASIAAFLLLALGLSRPFPPSRSELSRALSLPRVLAAAWVVGVPLVLARLHRPETWRTFSLWGPGALLVLFVASLAGVGALRRRRALAGLGVVAQLAVAYLALDQSNALLGYLVVLQNR